MFRDFFFPEKFLCGRGMQSPTALVRLLFICIIFSIHFERLLREYRGMGATGIWKIPLEDNEPLKLYPKFTFFYFFFFSPFKYICGEVMLSWTSLA